MTDSIAIVNYGIGNLRSVMHALMRAAPNAHVFIASDAAQLRAADRIVLPGQGAMPDCMRALRALRLLEPLHEAARTKPILGVCIGQQILFDSSAEGNTNGLGWMPGTVQRFALENRVQEDGSRFKVPQMGWNRVTQTHAHPLWKGIPDQSFFYFVHSYYVVPDHPDCIAGQTTYGVTFACAVMRENIFATQFHPEKSAQLGLQLYCNFVKWHP